MPRPNENCFLIAIMKINPRGSVILRGPGIVIVALPYKSQLRVFALSGVCFGAGLVCGLGAGLSVALGIREGRQKNDGQRTSRRRRSERGPRTPDDSRATARWTDDNPIERQSASFGEYLDSNASNFSPPGVGLTLGSRTISFVVNRCLYSALLASKSSLNVAP